MANVISFKYAFRRLGFISSFQITWLILKCYYRKNRSRPQELKSLKKTLETAMRCLSSNATSWQPMPLRLLRVSKSWFGLAFAALIGSSKSLGWRTRQRKGRNECFLGIQTTLKRYIWWTINHKNTCVRPQKFWPSSRNAIFGSPYESLKSFWFGSYNLFLSKIGLNSHQKNFWTYF